VRISSSVAGELESRAVPLSERVELLKWLAFALMVVDHLGKFAHVQLPGWVFLGRGAYPFFALAFGYALSVVPDARALLVRLVACGFVAECLGAWSVTRGVPVNVLFSFALCAYLLHRLRVAKSPYSMIVPVLLVYLLAGATEYGVAGVLLIASAWFYFCSPSPLRAGMVAVASVFLVVPNGGMWWGSLWSVVGLALLFLPVGLPRVRRVFYVLYVAQWPALWVLS